MKRANWLKRLPSRGLGFLSQLGWGELQLTFPDLDMKETHPAAMPN